MYSRRELLHHLVTAAGMGPVLMPGRQTSGAPRFFNLQRSPDAILAQGVGADRVLKSIRAGRWVDGDLAVTLTEIRGAVRVQLASPSAAVRRVRLRWNGLQDDVRLILGDAWERGYGDLEWRGFVPDRVMPWYFATTDGRITNCYGVRTGASALCFWHADPQGISLWLDVRSGGAGVELGSRDLTACEIVTRQGRAGESSFAAIRAFCRDMCPTARLPAQPVYGSNDWYWAYGRNSAATVLADAQNIVELSPAGSNRPFAVIDDGWQPERGAVKSGVGTWDRGNEKFPDMAGLAGEIRGAGARPGIWIRPLLAPAGTPDSWRLPTLIWLTASAFGPS